MNSIRIAIAMVVALASTSAAHAACDPVPYTTKMTNLGGEMQASLASKLGRGLLKYVPVGSDGTVGSEYVANSISGTQYDAYSAVIENFRCRVNEKLQRGIVKGKIVQDDADRFDANVDVLASFLVDLLTASAQASAAKQGIGEALLKLDEQQTNTLAGRLKPISAETRAAVKRVTDKVTAKDFTEIKRVTGWAKLRSSYGDLNLCGGAIFAISEEMHPVLQVALSQLPQFFNRFVRGDAMSTGPVKPFLVSYASVAQTQITATAPTMTEQFRGCTNELVDKLDQITPEKLKSKG